MKVSSKVGRRIRKHTSSITRRRLRSKKSYKKNSYRKKYTQKGGCWGAKKGGARGRKYKRAHTHKRGKRFHRGGFGGEDIPSGSTSGIPPTLLHETDTRNEYIEPGSTPGSQPTLLPETNINTLDDNMLPISIRKFPNKTTMPHPLNFDYKRTDKHYKLGGTESGLFDVVLLQRGTQTTNIELLRHSKNAPTEYDKQLSISIGPFQKNSYLSQPFTGIEGYTIHDSRADGTYTLPATDKNKESFKAINKAIQEANKEE
jgi:hypothetical protein